MIDHSELAIQLKSIREDAGFTQAELARRAGLSLYTLAKLEQGKVQQPSFFTVLALVEQLDASLDELCGITAATDLQPLDDAWNDVSWCFVDPSTLITGWFDAVSKLAETINVDSVKLENLFLKYKQALLSGKISVYEFEQIVKDQFEVSSRKIDLRSLWFETLHTPNNLAAQLRQLFSNDVKVGLLGQITKSLLEDLIKHEVLPSFIDNADHWILGLHTAGDTSLFEAAERTADVLPKRLLLISDSTELITAAQSRNWNTHLFET
jgi:transcriptional regulator with XRE-family HTH domain